MKSWNGNVWRSQNEDIEVVIAEMEARCLLHDEVSEEQAKESNCLYSYLDNWSENRPKNPVAYFRERIPVFDVTYTLSLKLKHLLTHSHATCFLFPLPFCASFIRHDTIHMLLKVAYIFF